MRRFRCPDALTSDGYARLVAPSAGFTALLAWVWWRMGFMHPAGISLLRDSITYSHIALAFAFAWPALRRQLGSNWGIGAYLFCYLAAVGLYVTAQRWWLSLSLDFLLVVAVFMTHHAANEVLFRRQSRNGYQNFTWTARQVAWVALAVGLVLVDRLGSPAHPWHGAQALLAATWGLGWLAYGWRYIRPLWRSPTSLGGWLAAGALGVLCAQQPTGELIFTSRARFSWIVIYHCVIWYAFYTRKLLARSSRWTTPLAAGASIQSVWRFLKTTPAGFVLLAAGVNALVATGYLAALPVITLAESSLQVNFFEILTIAHILFGVGAPQLAAASARSVPDMEPLPQFA